MLDWSTRSTTDAQSSTAVSIQRICASANRFSTERTVTCSRQNRLLTISVASVTTSSTLTIATPA